LKNKEYTLESYKHTIQWLKGNGYVFIPFPQYRKSLGLYALLRHNVLYSPERALSLAVEEKKLDVRSTYFIDLHSPWYNAFDPHVKKVLHIITDLGHYLGIYINPTFWDIPLSCFPTERVVKKDRRVFEVYYPYSVSAVGFDNGVSAPLLTSEVYDNLINADSDDVGKLYKWISVYHKDVLGKNIQLSVCPVFWTAEYMPFKKKVVTSIVNRMEKYYKDRVSVKSE